MARRNRVAIGAGIVAVAVVIAAIAWIITGQRSGADDLRSNGNGGLTAEIPGLAIRVDAPPGTFEANQPLTVHATETLPDIGRASLVTTPVLLSAAVQPAHQIVLETTTAFDVDPGLTVGVLWDEDTGERQLLGVEQLGDGRLRAHIPHFSGFAILEFPSLFDLTDWLDDIAGAAWDSLLDFFDAPYECPTPKFDTTLLDIWRYPQSVSLQIDVRDEPNIAGAAQLELCNRHRFPYEVEAHGAGQVGAVAMPRSTVKVDAALRGAAGAPFVVDAAFSPATATLLVLLAVVDLLPSGETVGRALLQEGLLDAEIVSRLKDVTQTCSSAISAALQTKDLRLWTGAVACLANQPDFTRLVVDVVVQKAADIGLDWAASAAAVQPHVAAVLGLHAIVRLVIEWVKFGPPAHLTFEYRLRCTLPGDGQCGPRGPETPSATPTGPSPPGQNPPSQDPPSQTPPAMPSGLTATPISTSTIRLRWSDNSNNETGFTIDNGDTSVNVGANTTTYDWGGLAPDTYMCFKIRAFNGAGTSNNFPASDPWYVCTSTLSAGPGSPDMPSGLTATPISTSTIRLHWSDNSGNETGFTIDNGDMRVNVGANTTTYDWGGLAPDTYMCFKIRAFNASGVSPFYPSTDPYYVCTSTLAS